MHGVQGAWGPQLAMNRFLPLLAIQIPTLWIHTSGGGGSDIRSMSSIRTICKCRAHLCSAHLYLWTLISQHTRNQYLRNSVSLTSPLFVFHICMCVFFLRESTVKLKQVPVSSSTEPYETYRKKKTNNFSACKVDHSYTEMLILKVLKKGEKRRPTPGWPCTCSATSSEPLSANRPQRRTRTRGHAASKAFSATLYLLARKITQICQMCQKVFIFIYNSAFSTCGPVTQW